MKARVRRTIKVFSRISVARFPKSSGVAHPEVTGRENGGDLVDYVRGWVLSVFHANLRSREPQAMDEGE